MFGDISVYIPVDANTHQKLASACFQFYDYVTLSNASDYFSSQYLCIHLPLERIANLLTREDCRKVAKSHCIPAGTHTTLLMMKSLFENHHCNDCPPYLTVFVVQPSAKEHNKAQRKKTGINKANLVHEQTHLRVAEHCSHLELFEFSEPLEKVFPPPPLDKMSSITIMNEACKKLTPDSFEEAGCAVCGQLTPMEQLSRLSAIKNYLHILNAPGLTRREWRMVSDPIQEHLH